MTHRRTDFELVGDFHEKFGLDNVTWRGVGPRPISEEFVNFRIKFMSEELHEFILEAEAGNHEGMFDALLDLSYVVLGTAQGLGYPWTEGFDEVQRANMSKERCEIDHPYVESTYSTDLCKECGKSRVKHSLRGQKLDVIKPAGWMPPNIHGLLKRWGFFANPE